MRIDLGTQGAKLGLGDLLEEERLAALAFDGLALAVKGIQAVAALGGDAAQVVEIAGYERRPPWAWFDAEHPRDATVGVDRHENLEIQLHKLAVEQGGHVGRLLHSGSGELQRAAGRVLDSAGDFRLGLQKAQTGGGKKD